MTQDDFNKSLLALTLWREARGEGPDGMQAVGCVIRNRVNNNRVATWASVMEGKWQFSSLTAPGDPELVVWPLPEDPSWKQAMLLSEGIYSNTLTDITGGATHYFATSIPTPTWAEAMTLTVQIGHQKFYK